MAFAPGVVSALTRALHHISDLPAPFRFLNELDRPVSATRWPYSILYRASCGRRTPAAVSTNGAGTISVNIAVILAAFPFRGYRLLILPVLFGGFEISPISVVKRAEALGY